MAWRNRLREKSCTWQGSCEGMNAQCTCRPVRRRARWIAAAVAAADFACSGCGDDGSIPGLSRSGCEPGRTVPGSGWLEPGAVQGAAVAGEGVPSRYRCRCRRRTGPGPRRRLPDRTGVPGRVRERPSLPSGAATSSIRRRITVVSAGWRSTCEGPLENVVVGSGVLGCRSAIRSCLCGAVVGDGALGRAGLPGPNGRARRRWLSSCAAPDRITLAAGCASLSLFHPQLELARWRVRTAWTRLVIRVVEQRSLRRIRQDLRVAMACSTRARTFAWDRLTVC